MRALLNLKHSLLAIILACVLSACGGGLLPPDQSPAIPTTAPVRALTCDTVLVGGVSPRLPTLAINDVLRCRPEFGTALSAIARGSFRYDQDDQTFGNYEKHLPAATSGTYREYTVVTPGASSRATRRIITAGSPARRSSDYTTLYYTDDHYDSFWIVTK